MIKLVSVPIWGLFNLTMVLNITIPVEWNTGFRPHLGII